MDEHRPSPPRATRKNGQHLKNNVCQDIKGREVPRPQKRIAKAGLTASRGPTCTYWQESEAQWAPSRGQAPPPQRSSPAQGLHQEAHTGDTPGDTPGLSNPRARPPAGPLTDTGAPTDILPDNRQCSAAASHHLNCSSKITTAFKKIPVYQNLRLEVPNRKDQRENEFKQI